MQIEMTKTGKRKNVSAHVAKVLISRNLARAVEEDQVAEAVAPTYQTRMMTAEAPVARKVTKKATKQVGSTDAAPYGLKADGTPRKRPAPQRKAV